MIGIDNVAARFAVQRQASVNHEAGRHLERMACALNDNLCVAIGVPGEFNVADYPSRNQRIPKTREIKKPNLLALIAPASHIDPLRKLGRYCSPAWKAPA